MVLDTKAGLVEAAVFGGLVVTLGLAELPQPAAIMATMMVVVRNAATVRRDFISQNLMATAPCRRATWAENSKDLLER
jgi:hypothetical protein